MDFINELYQIILDRKKNLPEDSYTTTLFKSGIDRILKKVLEEAGEVMVAGKGDNRDDLIYETADLMYHLLVLLAEWDIDLNEINNELKRRHKE